jgi:hypothetical protein
MKSAKIRKAGIQLLRAVTVSLSIVKIRTAKRTARLIPRDIISSFFCPLSIVSKLWYLLAYMPS